MWRVRVFCSHSPVGCSRLPSLLQQIKHKLIMNSTSLDSTATMKSWKKKKTNATFGIDEKWLVQVVLLQNLGCTFGIVSHNWITLHCPFHESPLSNCYWMGYRRYSTASWLEVLLDEDHSRSSSRVHEHGSFLLVAQLHVAIQTLWSQCLFPRAVWTNPWIVHFQQVSVLTWSASGLPALTIGSLVFGWVCWESSPPPATSEPNSFLQLSLKEIFGGGRGDAYTFSYMISPVSIMIASGIQ